LLYCKEERTKWGWKGVVVVDTYNRKEKKSFCNDDRCAIGATRCIE
jgi:hypothetical protein